MGFALPTRNTGFLLFFISAPVNKIYNCIIFVERNILLSQMKKVHVYQYEQSNYMIAFMS